MMVLPNKANGPERQVNVKLLDSARRADIKKCLELQIGTQDDYGIDCRRQPCKS